MKKNEYIEAKCIDYTHDGQGIVKVDSFPIFVKNMLVNEVGKAKIIKVLKNYAVGRLIEIYETSPYRQVPLCPIFKQCGGCHLQHLSLAGQQNFKTKRVKDTLERIGHCHVEVQPCLMMEEPWYYRNKVQVPVGTQGNTIVTGFYKQHSNDIVPMDKCYIQNEASNQLINRVRILLQEVQETPYDKVTHQGNIRHILVKYAFTTQQLMLVFITYQKRIKKIDYLISTLKKEFPHLTTVIQNINSRHDNVILGDEIKVIDGSGYIEDQLLGNTYRISVKSFYQVNPIQVEHLYQKAIDFAELKPTDEVIDAYCGIGTISLSMAQYVQKVYGVEIVEQAIIDAKENAIRNGISNVEFTCQDAGEFMVEFAKKNKHIDVVMVDPPRKGCSQIFLDQLITLAPDKVVYISCDVATQARDIACLQEHGYIADICQPVDMFPQSHHIENIVRLYKQ
ncbi:MAG: 23S rRNA (uracil(1939)-C(5))-methyltransferase RlmD [Coprobacillus cateniformis]|uniref:23S rRNA (uracil(1939)-C(5))-methyltransferase RlmD n=1 Tax=Longibaculum muris TaxID=1796628 RepID=UPI003AB8D650|nr:23S rRNA (uracil(1939)-C(5))-methyltransferase RlmD [Coprobacillus cateniformis]